jgi:hypothetical protein
VAWRLLRWPSAAIGSVISTFRRDEVSGGESSPHTWAAWKWLGYEAHLVFVWSYCVPEIGEDGDHEEEEEVEIGSSELCSFLSLDDL